MPLARLRSSTPQIPGRTAYGDYAFRLCLTRDGFKAIPEMLISGDRQMIVLVEGRRPRCWGVSKLATSPSFAPSALKTKKKKLRQHNNNNDNNRGRQQPPSPTQSEKKRRPRARVQPSSNQAIKRAGRRWPERGGDPLSRGKKPHPLLKKRPKQQQQQQ